MDYRILLAIDRYCKLYHEINSMPERYQTKGLFIELETAQTEMLNTLRLVFEENLKRRANI